MTRGLKASLVLLGASIVASPVAAEITTSHLASDAEMLSILPYTLVVGEGRIGHGLGTATFEADLGGDTGNPPTTAQYDWPNGTAVPWTLTYDHVTNLITFVVDDVTLTYPAPLEGFTDIFVRARAVNVDSDRLVNDLILESGTLGDASREAGNGLGILRISGVTPRDGFTISGRTTMSWTGATPNQPCLAFQIEVGNLKPVYVAPATWGRLKKLFSPTP